MKLPMTALGLGAALALAACGGGGGLAPGPEDPALPLLSAGHASHAPIVDLGAARTGGTMRPGVIAHEIIHLLGRGHVDPARFPGTIMAALTGTMDFTGLEHWPANAAPGAVGSGAAWHDGDLRYVIEVRGNTFHRTGGDAGTVTGAFFGPAHEAMGGVLEREDLDAGFAGLR